MNVTTLNMTTLDGNVIIKKGGGTPTPPSGGGDSGWEYYKVDSSFRVSEDESVTLNDTMETLKVAYYMGTISSGVLLPSVYISSGAYTEGFKVKGEGLYYDRFQSIGIASLKDLAKEPAVSELGLTAALPFLNALTPCTKEEFEALITK